jgi:hypothetical protein
MVRGGRREGGILPPDPGAGPWAELAYKLHQELYIPRDRPSVKTISQRTGISAGHVSKILNGRGRSRWESVGEALVGFLGGDPVVWEPRWKDAEERYQRGIQLGELIPLPGVGDDDTSVRGVGLAVDDWSVRHGPSHRFRRLTVIAAGFFAVAGALSPYVLVHGRVQRGRLAVAILTAAAIAALFWWWRGRKANVTERRRQVMLRKVQSRAAGIAKRAEGGRYLVPTFAVLKGRAATGQGKTGKRKGRPASSPLREACEAGTTIRTLYELAGEELVLVADAGLGKTIQMAKLACQLAAEALDALETRARDDGRPPPIPILLSLSIYRGEPLQEWMITEINRAYGVDKGLIRAWLDEDLLLPLLDGLDQVPEPHRRECAVQIQRFRQRCTGIVVSCRSRDYHLARTIKVACCVEIDPPSRQQVQDYLTDHADALADVHAALKADQTLWTLLCSPLMLNIIKYTYTNRPATELRQAGSVRQRQGRIFDAYLRRMLDYRPTRYQHDMTINWLCSLARTLSRHGEDVLYLDRLDDSWIPAERRKFSRVAPRYVAQLLAASLTLAWLFTAVALDVIHADLWLPSFLMAGLLVMSVAQAWSSKPFAVGVICAAIFTPITAHLLPHGQVPSAAIFLGISYVWATWTTFEGFLRTNRTPIEELRWTWIPSIMAPLSKREVLTRSGFLGAAIGVLQIALFGYALYLVIPDAFAKLNAVFGLAITVIYLLGSNFEPALLDSRPRPNAGIRRSLRFALLLGGLNALIVAVTFTALIAVVAPRASGVQTGLIAGYAGAIYGISRGFRFGGYACVYYWTNRVILARRGEAPLRYQRFLEDAEQRILVQRIGSGFAFSHRLLQEHLNTTPGQLLKRLGVDGTSDSGIGEAAA